MKRRDVITLLAGAAVAPPLAVRAQQPAMPVVGFLNHGSASAMGQYLGAFRRGLAETGFVEGRNVRIEYRWAEFDLERLRELAADLVRRQVAVIATPVNTPAAQAAKAATTTIPVVFGIGTDPVEAGLVVSLNRPGGNVTGVAGLNWELAAKRLGLLHELALPQARLAVLANPREPTAELFIRDAREAAASVGREIDILTASTSREIDNAFAELVRRQAGALLISPEASFLSRRVQLVGLSLRHGVPTLYPWREAVEIGGLMSYGSALAEIFREVGVYCGRILKGEKPGELPIMRASKFELVINLQTARTLGLTVPPTLLARADEVLE